MCRRGVGPDGPRAAPDSADGSISRDAPLTTRSSRPRRPKPMTESTAPTPQPDLTILSSRVYRGPNVWHYEPAIQLVVDLGVLEDFPTNKLPGFADGLVERLPGLPTTPAAAAGAAGSSSGCTRAPGSATSPSTSPCSCSSRSATTCGAARPAQVKGVRGRYNVIYAYYDESVGLAAGELAVRLVNDLVAPRPGVRLRGGARAVHRPRRADRVRPVHPGHRRGGGQPGHPLPPAEHRLAGPARPGRTRQADPGHHDLADLLGRGGHRQQQGADPQPAGRRRAAGAPVGVGAQRSTTPSGWPTGSAIPWCSSRWTATTAAA